MKWHVVSRMGFLNTSFPGFPIEGASITNDSVRSVTMLEMCLNARLCVLCANMGMIVV